MRTAIAGATKGMGRAMARLLAARGDGLFLLGRDEEELARSAGDLEARSGRGEKVRFARMDLADRGTIGPALAAAADALGGLDLVVLTAADFAVQDELASDPDRLARLLDVNFTGSVLFCEAARKKLMESGGGRLCVFSSVAGDRGRKPVVLYGATKGGLSRYLEGLDHRYRREGLITTCVKPGFVRTGMTEGLPEPPFAGEPEAVARRVLRAVERGRPVVYAPAIWRPIMLVIRLLPRFVMRRIGF